MSLLWAVYLSHVELSKYLIQRHAIFVRLQLEILVFLKTIWNLISINSLHVMQHMLQFHRMSNSSIHNTLVLSCM